MDRAFDVVCLGEVLLEVATQQPYGHDHPAVLGLSGDALNAAAVEAGRRLRHLGTNQVGVTCGVDGVPTLDETHRHLARAEEAE